MSILLSKTIQNQDKPHRKHYIPLLPALLLSTAISCGLLAGTAYMLFFRKNIELSAEMTLNLASSFIVTAKGTKPLEELIFILPPKPLVEKTPTPQPSPPRQEPPKPTVERTANIPERSIETPVNTELVSPESIYNDANPEEVTANVLSQSLANPDEWYLDITSQDVLIPGSAPPVKPGNMLEVNADCSFIVMPSGEIKDIYISCESTYPLVAKKITEAIQRLEFNPLPHAIRGKLTLYFTFLF